MENINLSENWKKGLMYGSLAGAAVLFLSGRRPASFALAGVGLAVLAAEHPEKFEEVWNNAPEYLDRGTKLVHGLGQFVEKLAEQGQKLQQMKNQVTNAGTPYRV